MQVGNHVITQKSLYIALFVIGESAGPDVGTSGLSPCVMSARRACQLVSFLLVVVSSASLEYCIGRKGPGSVVGENQVQYHQEGIAPVSLSVEPYRSPYPAASCSSSGSPINPFLHPTSSSNPAHPGGPHSHARPYLTSVPSRRVPRRTQYTANPPGLPLLYLGSPVSTFFWLVGSSAILILGHACLMEPGVESEYAGIEGV